MNIRHIKRSGAVIGILPYFFIPPELHQFIEGSGLTLKKEFHVTFISAKEGRLLKSHLEKGPSDPEVKEGFEKAKEEFYNSLQFLNKPVKNGGDYHLLEKNYPEGEVRRSLILAIGNEAASSLYDLVRSIFSMCGDSASFNSGYKRAPLHITLASASTNMKHSSAGIGLSDRRDFEALSTKVIGAVDTIYEDFSTDLKVQSLTGATRAITAVPNKYKLEQFVTEGRDADIPAEQVKFENEHIKHKDWPEFIKLRVQIYELEGMLKSGRYSLWSRFHFLGTARGEFKRSGQRLGFLVKNSELSWNQIKNTAKKYGYETEASLLRDAQDASKLFPKEYFLGVEKAQKMLEIKTLAIEKYRNTLFGTDEKPLGGAYQLSTYFLDKIVEIYDIPPRLRLRISKF